MNILKMEEVDISQILENEQTKIDSEKSKRGEIKLTVLEEVKIDVGFKFIYKGRNLKVVNVIREDYYIRFEDQIQKINESVLLKMLRG